MKQMIGLFVALLVMLVPAVSASHDVSQLNHDYVLDHATDRATGQHPIRVDICSDAHDLAKDLACADFDYDCARKFDMARDRECQAVLVDRTDRWLKKDICSHGLDIAKDLVCPDGDIDCARKLDIRKDPRCVAVDRSKSLQVDRADPVRDVETDAVPDFVPDRAVVSNAQFVGIGSANVDANVDKPDPAADRARPDRVTDRVVNWFKNLFGF